jgi:hypothetical protein
LCLDGRLLRGNRGLALGLHGRLGLLGHRATLLALLLVLVLAVAGGGGRGLRGCGHGLGDHGRGLLGGDGGLALGLHRGLCLVGHRRALLALLLRVRGLGVGCGLDLVVHGRHTDNAGDLRVVGRLRGEEEVEKGLRELLRGGVAVLVGLALLVVDDGNGVLDLLLEKRVEVGRRHFSLVEKREDACVGGPAIEMSVMADNSFSEKESNMPIVIIAQCLSAMYLFN